MKETDGRSADFRAAEGISRPSACRTLFARAVVAAAALLRGDETQGVVDGGAGDGGCDSYASTPSHSGTSRCP